MATTPPPTPRAPSSFGDTRLAHAWIDKLIFRHSWHYSRSERPGADADPLDEDIPLPIKASLLAIEPNGNSVFSYVVKWARDVGQDRMGAIIAKIAGAGAKLDHPNMGGRTPLHTASFNFNASAARALLAAGAWVDPVDSQGDTPLMDACRKGSREIVEILLEHGANPGHVNRAGQHPWDIAKAYQGQALEERLLALSETFFLSEMIPAPSIPKAHGSQRASRRI